MKTTKTILLLGALLLTFSCKKKDASATAASAAAALTSSQLAGNVASSCISGGGHTAGTGRTQGYNFQANGNYNYSVTVVDSATCAPGANELVKYTQFGTYTITGISNGATVIAFTIGSAAFSTPDATYRTYFNSTVNCGTPTLNLVGSSSSTVSTSGRTCTTYATFPTTLSTYYNIFTLTGTTLTANSGSLLWYSGTPSSAPTSLNTTYTYY